MRREARVRWRFARLLALALLASTLGACPGDEPHAAYLLWQAPGGGGFVPVGAAVDLGEVTPTTGSGARLALFNAGDSAVEVRSVTASDPTAFTVAVTAALPRRLGPGSRLEVEVTAAPTDACTAVGTLVVDADVTPAPLGLAAQGVDPEGSAASLALSAVDEGGAATLAGEGPLDFGARAAGDAAVRVLEVTNGGACPVTLEAPALAAEGAFTLPATFGAVELAPGGAIALPILFTAAGDEGERSARLALETSAGTREVELVGRVGAPSLTFRVGSGDDMSRPGSGGLDFGAAEVGARVRRVVRVVNDGGAAAAITGISCDLALFEVGWGEGEGALALAPGDAWDIPVVFSPDARGSQLGTLTVATEAGAVHLQLVGTGLAGALNLSVEAPPGSGAFEDLDTSGEIDFGGADPGDEVFRRVRLTNAGDGGLTITSATATNGFRTFLPVPVALGAGASRDFLIRFRPVATVASYSGVLEVQSDRGARTVDLLGALTRVCPAATAAPAVPEGPCVPSDTVLCLLDGRFAVTAANQTTACEGGVGAVATASDAAGAFTFGGDGWDLVVNLVDTCADTGTFGLAAAGPTRDRVELRVVDTETSAVKTWFNPLGEPFQPLIDGSAFDTCP